MLQELLQNVLNRDRTCDLAINSRTLYLLSYKNLETPFCSTSCNLPPNSNVGTRTRVRDLKDPCHNHLDHIGIILLHKLLHKVSSGIEPE